MNKLKIKKIDSKKIREIFLDFFIEKKHSFNFSSSLVPADPTVLFTSAGMQQFIPYLSGKIKPPFKRAVSVQKCFRTSDIDEVGDESHNTFFEMLGNWSFNDYFKEEAIDLALDLLINGYHFSKERLSLTIFAGSENLPRDVETFEIWKKKGFSIKKIKEFGSKDNFWGPVGASGPCGPCSEIHYDQGEAKRRAKCTISGCGPNCGCGRFVEIWNLVFMEYNKKTDQSFEKLPVKNIDTGAGLERMASILQRTESIFETDLFLPTIKKIEELTKSEYKKNKKAFRIVADHCRAACFLISDGVLPNKEDRGYVLRRIIRRTIRYGHLLSMPQNFLTELVSMIIDQYKDIYSELNKNKKNILEIIQKETERFEKTLVRGLGQFEKVIKTKTDQKKSKIIKGEEAFYLYETFGFPLELIKELAKEKGFDLDEKIFAKAFSKHQEISRAGAEKKFGGHSAEKVEDPEIKNKIIKLHTATHLLHVSLRKILGEHVEQAGSDINSERLRFDFKHYQKLSEEEKKKIEDLVNQKIKEKLKVSFKEMPFEEAIRLGALAFFREKYPKRVRVYSIDGFSKEICGGPHVENTKELGIFKIKKEESSGSGTRRIKAILQ